MTQANVPLPVRGFGQTLRRDNWWIGPALTFVVLLAFLIYANWVVITQQHHYYLAKGGRNYLSPFYSPLLFDGPGEFSHHAWMDHRPPWLPLWVTPAALILIFPAGFRFTCYYYRGAYYKAFWADPPSCAVGEPRSTYLGENSFPLILQNVHRYFLYAALLFLIVLSYDVWKALWFVDATGHRSFGIGLGTLVLLANVILLSGYTFGCHSLRHLVAGWRDEMSPGQSTAFRCATCLNRRHMVWAWCSLISVAFSDIYIRLCAMGVWTDWRLI